MNPGNGAAGERALVTLTYDGTLPSHLRVVLPSLQHFGFQATFFADPALMLDDLPAWRAAVRTGHEVGNGCLLAAALPDGSLPAWTPDMIATDVAEVDDLLRELFPDQADFSFAFPWGPSRCAAGRDYHRVVERRHEVCRSGEVGLNPIEAPTLNRLKCVPLAGADSAQMLDYVDAAVATNAWAILAFEGIGEGDRSVTEEAHEGLLDSLSLRRDLLRVVPLIEARAWLGMPTRRQARLM